MMASGKTSILKRARARAGERGLALLIVLWIIVSTALIVSSFNATVRSGMTFIGSEVQLATSEALLDAGLEIAAARLIDEDETQRWLPNGGRHLISFEGAELTISIRDGNSLIDLNKADKELLLHFLLPYAGSEAKATWIRDRILQARGTKPGDNKEARHSANTNADGDEQEEEAEKPLPFIDATQLRQIEGMTAEVYQQIVPFVTVYSRDGRINPAAAPDEVLLAIPELTSSDIDRLRASAGSDKDNDAALTEISQRAGAFLADGPGPAYVVSVGVRTSEGHTAGKVYVIAVGVDGAAPYRLLSKRAPGAMRRAKRG